MSTAKIVAAILVAVVVTAAVTTLLAIPALYAHLRGQYRETVTTTQTITAWIHYFEDTTVTVLPNQTVTILRTDIATTVTER